MQEKTLYMRGIQDVDDSQTDSRNGLSLGTVAQSNLESYVFPHCDYPPTRIFHYLGPRTSYEVPLHGTDVGENSTLLERGAQSRSTEALLTLSPCDG